MWDVGFKDTYHKPLETIKMLGVKPDMKVAEVGRLNGYWIPILAAAVGKEGKVYRGNNYAIALENDFVWYQRSLRTDAHNASIAVVDINTKTAAGADLVNGLCVDDVMMQTTPSRAGFEPGSPVVPFLDLRKGFSSMDFGADAGQMDIIMMQYVLNFQSEDFVRDPLHAIVDKTWNNLKLGGIFYMVDYECDSSAMSREGSAMRCRLPSITPPSITPIPLRSPLRGVKSHHTTITFLALERRFH
jgi:predicted methyltransferase